MYILIIAHANSVFEGDMTVQSLEPFFVFPQQLRGSPLFASRAAEEIHGFRKTVLTARRKRS